MAAKATTSAAGASKKVAAKKAAPRNAGSTSTAKKVAAKPAVTKATAKKTTRKAAPRKAAAKPVAKSTAKQAPKKPRVREQVLTAAEAKALTKTKPAGNKTVATKQSVAAFLKAVPDERRRADAKRLDAIMRDITGEKPVMWGDAIVGYGTVKQTYATGRVVDWMRVGFAPRKAAISLYASCDLTPLRPLLDKMGPHTTGVGCIYVKRLDDLDEGVLRELIERSYALAPKDTAEVWEQRRKK